MIVLTGGPCSGKSSSLAYFTEKLSDHGYMVFVVPETATLITNSGIDRRKMNRSKQVVMYEEAILDMQLAFEKTYQETVSQMFPERKKVILLDRGIMDIKAFVHNDDFREMLKKKKLTEVKLRDRYNGVIHLVTAAEGALPFYTGENNHARIETPEEAIAIDHRIRESWLGHPHFRIIDNATDFEGKINRAFSAISTFLGLPAPLPITEKFLVTNVQYDRIPAHQVIHIEQLYLRSRIKSEEISIRKRGQNGSYLYFLSRKTSVEQEELITEQAYMNLKKLIDPKTNELEKERICFIWHDQYCELDTYKGEHEGIAVLKVEPAEMETLSPGISIPSFITIEANITGNPKYNERSIAKKQSHHRRRSG
ncbi:MAG TPA: AAA family ATPase [Syntrophorhabdaceae bacterium]|nr:AAA family ATPase [Syntrophorhabdaceae bacterium]